MFRAFCNMLCHVVKQTFKLETLILMPLSFSLYYFSLHDSWMRLGFQVDVKGRVPVKVVARTFASGKTEKMIYQCLSDLGLPSGKSDTMERDDFTFDKFYELYHKVCPRNDIEELFRTM